MTPKDYLTNKSFCPVPWTGFMYNFDGNVKNCIRSSDVIGNIKDNTIQEILHSRINVDTKALMLESNPGPRCHPCYALESDKNQFNIISDRVFYLRELKQVDKNIYNQPTNFDLHTVDIRWSNLCNFACVYCGPEFSSKWSEELKISIDTPLTRQKENLKEYIFNNVEQLKHVYLAGGEPLLMKENLEFLSLLQQKNPDVNLRINTNLSKIDTNIFDLICTFNNVHWIISVESIEQEYEYIRHGGKWNDFMTNLKQIQKLNHKISFNMLHFLLNFLSIFDCVDLLKKEGFHSNSFIIGALLKPDFLNIRNLPETALDLVKQKLQTEINKNHGFLLENGYQNMLTHISQPFDKNFSDSIDKLKEIDTRRKLHSQQIFRNLYDYI